MARPLIFFLLLAVAGQLRSQADTTALSRLLSDYRLKVGIGLQSWATYTMGMEVYDPEAGGYRPVDDRLNMQLRRTRITLSGQPYTRLRYNFVTALDQLGSDVYAATVSGSSNGNTASFRIWNAWLHYRLSGRSDGLHLIAGYFVPPVGRETATPALRSTSFEKAGSQYYLRRHLLNNGPGRAYGLMLAGQQHLRDGRLHLTYEGALTNPAFTALGSTTSGASYRPLLSARLSVQIGNPEAPEYAVMRRVNYFGKRRGLTLSVTGGQQGASDSFAENGVYGLEWLGNSGGWQVDGEYLWLRREGQDGDFRARTGYLRVGKNIPLGRELILEPVISYWFFRGPTAPGEVSEALRLDAFTGSDSGLDLGVNWYWNPDLRISLFYAQRRGGAAAGDPATTNNTYFQQAGVGSVRRGNYFGVGWIVVL